MILFILSDQKDQNYTYRKQINSVLELWVGVGIDWKWAKDNFWDEENVLRLGCVEGCIIVYI